MKKRYFVYILRSLSGKFHIGITDNLVKRVWQHNQKVVDSFTSKYNINMLIYYEIYQEPQQAIVREKQLKNRNRKKKIELIKKLNPTFTELIFDNLV